MKSLLISLMHFYVPWGYMLPQLVRVQKKIRM